MTVQEICTYFSYFHEMAQYFCPYF